MLAVCGQVEIHCIHYFLATLDRQLRMSGQCDLPVQAYRTPLDNC